jgi:hypothetical protein
MSLYEFHVSRKARDKFHFEDELFSTDGRVVLADFAAARRFAANMSADRPQPVPASDINAMGLLDEVLHILIRQYELQNPGVLARADAWLQKKIGEEAVDSALLRFTDEFPPLAVYRGEDSAQDYLKAATAGVEHRQTTLEELLLLHITNLNPATQPYKELFDDRTLQTETAYEQLVRQLSDFFDNQPGFGGKGSSETLIQVLRAPALASPHSLAGQLEFLLNRWGALLGDALALRLLRGMDYVREEIMRRTGAGGFSGEAPVLEYQGQPEYERFSQDREWMPRLVLLAKNA